MIKLNKNILLPLLVLFIFGIACQKSEEEKIKVETVNYLNQQFQSPTGNCRVKFEADYPKKGVLFANICSDYLEKGVSWQEILTPDNLKRMKSAGFQSIELKRWDLSTNWNLDEASEVYAPDIQKTSKESGQNNQNSLSEKKNKKSK
jgi:hypothetical protein